MQKQIEHLQKNNQPFDILYSILGMINQKANYI